MSCGRTLCVLLLQLGLVACSSDYSPVSPAPGPLARDTAPTGYLGFRVSGLYRVYRLHVPARLPGGPVPLVLALHGYSDNARNFEGATGFDELADTAGFIVAYPEGSGSPLMWNAGGGFEGLSGNANDVGFIRALVDTVAARYPIDRGRVYATGHSNGGFMMYRLAHELSSVLAAVAPVAGMEFDAEYLTPSQPIAILHVHALDDPIVPFLGGPIAGAPSLPVTDVIDRWRRLQNCAAVPDTLVHTAGVLSLRWRSGSGGGDIALVTTTSGGHAWQRRSFAMLETRDVIWAFFRSVPRRPQPGD